jgi:putative N-acetyltransferase (TIGR04045 family)
MARIVSKIVETEAERQGHFAVRRTVFVDEQGLFRDSDIDEHDDYAVHLVAIDQERGVVVGAVRCYETEPGLWYGGRLAVLEAYRYSVCAVGPRLCKLAEKVVIERGCRRFLANIQHQNVRFFERMGWRKIGEPVEQYGLLHQLMEASLVPEKAGQLDQIKGTYLIHA